MRYVMNRLPNVLHTPLAVLAWWAHAFLPSRTSCRTRNPSGRNARAMGTVKESEHGNGAQARRGGLGLDMLRCLSDGCSLVIHRASVLPPSFFLRSVLRQPKRSSRISSNDGVWKHRLRKVEHLWAWRPNVRGPIWRWSGLRHSFSASTAWWLFVERPCILMACSPSLKPLGIANRPRLFEMFSLRFVVPSGAPSLFPHPGLALLWFSCPARSLIASPALSFQERNVQSRDQLPSRTCVSLPGVWVSGWNASAPGGSRWWKRNENSNAKPNQSVKDIPKSPW